ncbi:MAG: TIGR00730 family Rossman fold protein [Xanthomonadales bacterium]|nr:TIGR00730 family Rossman fold protein [Xanthomonadales bacterium]
MKKIECITVYASASSALAPVYNQAATELGGVIARMSCDIVYGGGGIGLMGKLADGALQQGGRVYGIIPGFLDGLEQGHTKLTSQQVVTSMRIRKEIMLDRGDAVVALPGGSGTFEELFEALTLKRLGKYLGPIILINTNKYYDGLIRFLEQSVREGFMDTQHLQMWSVIDAPAELEAALKNAAPWSEDAISFAAKDTRRRHEQ